MIKIKNLNLYFGDNQIFKDFCLDVKKTQKIAITGKSGSGKTSLINILLGFVEFKAEEITVDNQILCPENIKSIRSKMAYLPQQVDIYFETVEELFYAPFLLKRNIDKRPSQYLVDKTFSALGLEKEILTKKINQISGGQKQRVVMASIILLDKQILLLDEPSSALDDQTIEKIYDYIYDNDKTILTVTHNKFIMAKSDQIISL